MVLSVAFPVNEIAGMDCPMGLDGEPVMEVPAG